MQSNPGKGLKQTSVIPGIECSVTATKPPSECPTRMYGPFSPESVERFETGACHRLRRVVEAGFSPDAAESAENATSQAHELLRTLRSALACQDSTPINSETLRQIILKATDYWRGSFRSLRTLSFQTHIYIYQVGRSID
jgi:hypothetical protein